jgi:hypothetical protein
MVLVGSSFNMEEEWEKTFGLFKEAIRPFGKGWGEFEGAVAPFA